MSLPPNRSAYVPAADRFSVRPPKSSGPFGEGFFSARVEESDTRGRDEQPFSRVQTVIFDPVRNGGRDDGDIAAGQSARLVVAEERNLTTQHDHDLLAIMAMSRIHTAR